MTSPRTTWQSLQRATHLGGGRSRKCAVLQKAINTYRTAPRCPRTGPGLLGREGGEASILKELKGAYDKMEIVERFPYGRDSYFAARNMNPNLNRAQRGEGMEKRLRGAIKKQGEAETGYRSLLGVGRITSSFASIYLLYWEHLDGWIMVLCCLISIFFLYL